MHSYLESLAFAANNTLPIFVIVLLGWWFQRIQLINEAFIAVASKLVFTAALPALIFINILQLDIHKVVDSGQILYALAATLLAFALLWWVAQRWIADKRDHGVFIQGSFRGNLGIIGLALCNSLYGAEGLALGSILLASMTLLYNVLSVFTLSVSAQDSARIDWRRIAADLVRNPLIIAIVSALPLAWLGIRLPPVLLQSGHYFANLTLPLALLCVGGAIHVRALRDSSQLSLWAVASKLLVLPSLQVLGAWWLGFHGALLGTLFLMFAAPTATVSFVMVKAIGGNARLAANIIALSTILSIFSVSAGIFLLRLANLI